MLFRIHRNKLISCSKCYCTATNSENVDTSLKSHIFCKPLYTSYVELAEYLQKNIIHKTNGLLILNRPQGLKKAEPSSERGFWLKQIRLNLSPTLESTDRFTFIGVLPYLKKKLKRDHLELLKAPDRHMSGISILSYRKDKVPQRVKRALEPPHLPKYTFLAVCNGIPVTDTDSVKLGVTLLERGGRKKSIFVKNYSKRSVAMEKVFPFTAKHKVLSVNKELMVSLVELLVNKNKWNAVRAYLAMRLLSPAVGDNLFGSYVQEINKTRIAVEPYSPAAGRPYRHPRHILDALELMLDQQSIIPLHIHLAQLDFLKYRTDGRIFTAKPPDHFFWTCEKLGLSVPEIYLENNVSKRLEKSSPPIISTEGETIEEENDDDSDSDDNETGYTYLNFSNKK